MDVTSINPNPKTCMRMSQLLARVGDKWLVLIIMMLQDGPKRFSELKRGIDGISQRMLTHTLRNMERYGFVTRTVTPSIPPRVDYQLTDLGHSLSKPVNALGAWAMAHLEEISQAQAQFDAIADAASEI